jgi:hypothetical protein
VNNKPLKVVHVEVTMKEDDDYLVTIQQTNAPINIEVPDKEFALQHTKRGWRCISWHPHYIMTDWVKTKKQALLDGDNAITKYYEEHNENILP